MQCCKTCKFLHVPLDKAGRRVVRAEHAYLCTKLVDMHALRIIVPSSILSNVLKALDCTRYMEGKEGQTCGTFEEYRKEG